MKLYNNSSEIEMEEIMEEMDGLIIPTHERAAQKNALRVVVNNNSKKKKNELRFRFVLILLAIISAFYVGKQSSKDILDYVFKEDGKNILDETTKQSSDSDSSSVSAITTVASDIDVDLKNNENKNDVIVEVSEEADLDNESTLSTEKKEESTSSKDAEVEPITSSGNEISNTTKNSDDVNDLATTANTEILNSEQKPKDDAVKGDWGKWNFFDEGPDLRPKDDYCAKYPNRDIPSSKFPENAWQTDDVYANQFINEASNLVQRVQEAILTEYGHGKSEEMTPEELIQRRAMFEFTYLNITNGDIPPGGKSGPKNAGSTTKRSFDGLVRRLLHAMMTNDTFTVVLGGHSAAAGHGNHFKQSYMMQFFYLMEPIFNRLGMKLVVRNISQGGLGTMQGALGSGDMYGSEVDVMVWDSSMTENSPPAYDLFARQALMQNRAPVLYHGLWNTLKELHEGVDADIFLMGNGMVGIPTTMNEEQVLTLNWATRSLVCNKERADLCNGDNGNKYRTKCWVDRPDVIPPTNQIPHVAGQASWHPGFRTHQLTGRLMSFVILSALEDALSIWSEKSNVTGHPLSDEFWHVTNYYNDIHQKLQTYTNTKTGCESLDAFFTPRVCKTPMYGRAEHTPRANPNETSLLTIIRPTSDGYLPTYTKELLYNGLDVPNPALFELPDGAIDVHAIASARRRKRRRNLQQQSSIVNRTHFNPILSNYKHIHHNLEEANDDAIIQGKGWTLDSNIPPGTCGGEYYDICGRDKTSNCLLSGHMDARGGIIGHSSSGWLVMDLPNVTKGIVILKVEDWHGQQHKEESFATWWCKTLLFDYAINGNITTLNKTELYYNLQTHPQRVVLLLNLLDDEEIVNEIENNVLEVAIRLRGCTASETKTSLTHVYWA